MRTLPNQQRPIQLPFCAAVSLVLYVKLPVAAPVPAALRLVLSVMAFIASVAWVAMLGNEVCGRPSAGACLALLTFCLCDAVLLIS
jgi:hypothetical protein